MESQERHLQYLPSIEKLTCVHVPPHPLGDEVIYLYIGTYPKTFRLAKEESTAAVRWCPAPLRACRLDLVCRKNARRVGRARPKTPF